MSETYNEVAETLADMLDNDTNDLARVIVARLISVLYDYRDSLDTKVIQSLEKALEDNATEVKLEVAGTLIALGHYKENNAYPILEDFIRGKDSEQWNTDATISKQGIEEGYEKERVIIRYRATAIRHIALDNTPETEALLVEMTKDPDSTIQGYARAMLERRFKKK